MQAGISIIFTAQSTTQGVEELQSEIKHITRSNEDLLVSRSKMTTDIGDYLVKQLAALKQTTASFASGMLVDIDYFIDDNNPLKQIVVCLSRRVFESSEVLDSLKTQKPTAMVRAVGSSASSLPAIPVLDLSDLNNSFANACAIFTANLSTILDSRAQAQLQQLQQEKEIKLAVKAKLFASKEVEKLDRAINTMRKVCLEKLAAWTTALTPIFATHATGPHDQDVAAAKAILADMRTTFNGWIVPAC